MVFVHFSSSSNYGKKKRKIATSGERKQKYESTSLFRSLTPSPSPPTRDMPVAQEIIIVFFFSSRYQSKKEMHKTLNFPPCSPR